MTQLRQHTVTLNEPREVLAALPHLVGFWPTDSLVLITLGEGEEARRFGLTLRVDLPWPNEQDQLADYLLKPIQRQASTKVILVVVGQKEAATDLSTSVDQPATAPGPTRSVGVGCLPHQGLIDTVKKTLGAAGITVARALWTEEIRTGAAWRCYDDPRYQGEVADPALSPLATPLIAAGTVTFSSRAELESLLASESASRLERRAARLDAMYEDLEQERASNGSQHDVDVVFAAIRQTAHGRALTEDDVVRILIALSDHRVRDLALGAALSEWSQAAEELWFTLVRKAPSPEVADVSALLAFSAYLRGEGALAGIALEHIETSRPEHRLGGLLRHALDAGIPPNELATIVGDAAEDARILIAEDETSENRPVG